MKPVMVGDVGINHCGSLRIAKAIVGMCAGLGVDMVKFQKRTVGKVYRKSALDKAKLTQWGSTKHHEKLGLEFGKEEYDEIDRWCKTIGIPWFASPWDEEAVDFLMQYKTPYMKIASACLANNRMVDKIVETGLPIIISIGMTPEKKIPAAIKRANKRGMLKHVLMCSSEYPTPDKGINRAGIGKLAGMLKGKEIRVGFSNHCRRVIHSAAAYAVGCEIIEFHATLDRAFPGDDQLASLRPASILKLREHLDALELGEGDGVLEPSESALAKLAQYGWRV